MQCCANRAASIPLFLPIFLFNVLWDKYVTLAQVFTEICSPWPCLFFAYSKRNVGTLNALYDKISTRVDLLFQVISMKHIIRIVLVITKWVFELEFQFVMMSKFQQKAENAERETIDERGIYDILRHSQWKTPSETSTRRIRLISYCDATVNLDKILCFCASETSKSFWPSLFNSFCRL